METTQIARIVIILLSLTTIISTFVNKRKQEKLLGNKIKLTNVRKLLLTLDVSLIIFMLYMIYRNL